MTFGWHGLPHADHLLVAGDDRALHPGNAASKTMSVVLSRTYRLERLHDVWRGAPGSRHEGTSGPELRETVKA